jgi:hypothetical protein
MRRAAVGFALVGIALSVLSARAEVTVTPLGGDSLAAGPVPTMKEVEGEFEDARYTICLQKISRVLSSSPAPSAEDQYTLLSLKGECLVRQKQGAPAAEAFGAAAHAGAEKADIAMATAMAELLRRSENFEYTPVTGKDRKPLPITNKAKRTPALAALFADEAARTKRLYDAAVASEEVQPVIDFATPLHALAMFELAATNGTAQTDAMQKALTAHAQELVTAAVTKLSADADAIAASAMQTVEVPAVGNLPPHRKLKGMTDADKQQIKDMAKAADALEATMKSVVTAYALDDNFFVDDTTAVETVKKRLHNFSLGNFRPLRPVAPTHAAGAAGH